jgi:hypothetical protein
MVGSTDSNLRLCAREPRRFHGTDGLIL